MAFSNTFVTLDDVSITNLANVAGQVVVVASDGLSVSVLPQSALVGYTGSQGDAGPQGNAGIQGFTGSIGAQGVIGFTGSQGAGFTGSQGDTGYTGSIGDEGNIGFTGSTAFGFTVIRNQQDPANVIIADQFNDVLTYNAGSGMQIDFNTGTDTITFSAPGALGYTGSIGFTGSIGGTGFTGSAGPNGFNGSKGDQGYTGSQGDRGNIGFIGSAGVRGWTGSRGFNGSIGFSGSQGFDGSIGFGGSRGFQGFSGSSGFTGSQGVQGNVGFTGSKGIQGNVGFNGSRGNTGFVGSRGLQGFTGSRGAEGFTGSTGMMGFTGSQGDQGTPGYVGSTGFQGSQGAIGDDGYTGSRGFQGYSGSRGFTGSVGERGLLGPTGATGFAGSQGLRGFTGSAPVAFRTFRVIDGARQENVIADQEEDVIDFIAGAGITLNTDADLDQIIFSAQTAEDILADLSVVNETPTGSISVLNYNQNGEFRFTSASPDDIVAAANIDLSNYYTKSETYNKAEVNALVASANANVDLSNYYTKPETNVLLANKMGSFTVTNGSTLFTVTDAETVNLLGTPGQIENTLNAGTQSVTWSLADELALNNVTVNGSLFSNDITADAILVDGDTTITGNLLVLGNTTTINSNVISSGDTIIVLNADLPSTIPPTQNLGLEGNRGNQANVFLIWDEAADVWTVQDQTFVARNFVGNIDLSGNSIVDLNDVSVSGLDDGEILIWDAGNAVWTNSESNISSLNNRVSALESNVSTLQTDVTVLQGNIVSIENELANIADTDSQTLSWDLGTANLSISNGNTVNLAGLGDQTLSLNTTSNVLTISDGNSVDFTPILGGGGGAPGTTTVERFRIDYTSGGSISGVSGLTSGISSVTVTDAAAGLIQITLDNGTYTLPPAQLTYFGYSIPNDEYRMQALTDTITTRFIDGDSGAAFGGSSTIVLDLLADTASTRADGGFGGAPHAYIQMTCTTV